MPIDNENTLNEIFAQVPGRFQAALQFIHWVQSITDPCRCCNPIVQGRALTPREQAAYDAALTTMRMYLAGEVDMGGPGMTADRSAEPAADDPAPPPAAYTPFSRIDGPGFPSPSPPGDGPG